MKAIKLVVVTLCLLLSSLVSQAQLYFQNNTEEPVHVAICMYYDGKSAKLWGSEGWWLVEPGHKVQVSPAIGLNPNIYYYAKSTISKKEYIGNNNLLVNPTEKFFIKNADKSYQQTQNPAFVWKPFREVNKKTGMFQTKYTIELKPLGFDDVAEVSGTLKEVKYQAGGAMQKTHVLTLDKPMTVSEVTNIKEIQIMFDDSFASKAGMYLNKNIVVKGMLVEESTSYHIRPVMLIGAKVK